jgi:uncharacterized membrane protein YkgB
MCLVRSAGEQADYTRHLAMDVRGAEARTLGGVHMTGTRWMDRTGSLLLRLSLAIVFGWFGLLKLFGLCPLGGFVCRTLPFLPANACLTFLGAWEVVIGLCLLVPPLVRIGLGLLLLHLPGTVLPFLVLPQECFDPFPYGLTVEGQYIVKNLVLASAALTVAMRGNASSRRRGALAVALPE